MLLLVILTLHIVDLFSFAEHARFQSYTHAMLFSMTVVCFYDKYLLLSSFFSLFLLLIGLNDGE
jgi:hypothetical protein